MKCKLKLINENWYAENLGETSANDLFNCIYEGKLYKVHHNSPRLLEDGKEVECEFINEFTNPELYRDIPWGDGELYVRIISKTEKILNETSLEVKDKVKSRVNLDTAVEYIQSNHFNGDFNEKLMYVVDVQEVIKILTGVEVPTSVLVYKP